MISLTLEDIKSSYIEKFGDSVVLSKCKEEKCQLKGISEDFIILNGDFIEESSGKANLNPSVDCILVKNVFDESYNIVLCELSKGSKKRSLVKDKMINSGNLIYDIFSQHDWTINRIYCLYLGDYKVQSSNKKMKNKPSKRYRRPFAIREFRDLLIKNEHCGFDVNKLFRK